VVDAHCVNSAVSCPATGAVIFIQFAEFCNSLIMLRHSKKAAGGKMHSMLNGYCQRCHDTVKKKVP
jgi:hypothetical protein